jgi:hypothetical protein
MSILTEIGRTFEEITDASGNSWDAMSERELTTMMQGLGVASYQCACALVERCGADDERARLEISRAMELPSKVLHRRANECREIIQRDDVPNIPQHAAWIAIMLKEIQKIGARIEQA